MKKNKKNSPRIHKAEKINTKINTSEKSRKSKKPSKHEDNPIEKRIDGDWEISVYRNIKLSKPILIEGMPGIGNVGKVSMDILIEETGAQLLMSFFSKSMPNSVFVNEDNLVDLPKMSMYHKKIKNNDFLFLTGDVQPMTSESCYDFVQLIADYFKDMDGSFIITLGGIGLSELPENPKVFLTGNGKDFVHTISDGFHKRHLKHETKIYGHVGPILGVSGVMLGVSKKSGIDAYCLLAETFGHPIYVGLKSAKAILEILNSNYSFGLKFDKLNKEIIRIDRQIQGLSLENEEDGSLAKYKKHSDVNYIG